MYLPLVTLRSPQQSHAVTLWLGISSFVLARRLEDSSLEEETIETMIVQIDFADRNRQKNEGDIARFVGS